MNSHYGVFCRYTDEAFYYFATSTDGQAVIYRREQNGELTVLTAQDISDLPFDYSEAADTRLLAVCHEDNLTLYINGDLVTQVVDDALYQKAILVWQPVLEPKAVWD